MTTTTTTTTNSMQTVILKVGLHCEGCERRVKKAIWHIKGITSVDVDNNRERITVTGFVDPSRILKAVKKTGKPVELWKYQNGNKNLYGSHSQPITTTPTNLKLSNAAAAASKGNKANNNNSNKQHAGFQSSNKLSEQDRSRHPLPDYISDADSDFEAFSEAQSYGKGDYFTEFKSPKNQKAADLYSDFKSPKNHQYDEFKSPKNQKTADFYDEFKAPKNQKKNDFYSDFKPPKDQKSDYFGNFKSPKNQQEKQPGFKLDKSRSEYTNSKGNDYSQFGSDDEIDFGYSNRKSNNQQPSYDNEKISLPKSKSSPYPGYENHNELQKSGGKPQYSVPAFDNEEKSYNQKKPKSQLPPKYVSFEDDYQQKYRPQSEANHRPQERGYEQKFYPTYGQEQNLHYPSYSYAYENNRVPASNGFSTLFSEENPNACSVM